VSADYQPRWDGTRTVGVGQRDVETRWAAIAPHVPERSRLLDLGAAQGYFAARAVDEKSCTVVAVDPDLNDFSDVQNVQTVRRIVSPEDVEAFGKFDVALALNILHHVGRWRDMLDVLVANATTVIVETPHPDETLKDRRKNERLQDIYDATRGTVLCETLSVYRTHMRQTVLL